MKSKDKGTSVGFSNLDWEVDAYVSDMEKLDKEIQEKIVEYNKKTTPKKYKLVEFEIGTECAEDELWKNVDLIIGNSANWYNALNNLKEKYTITPKL